MKIISTCILSVLFCVLTVEADTALVSNFTYAVTPGSNTGELWALSRGDASAANGYSLLRLNTSGSAIQLESSQNIVFDKGITGVNFQELGNALTAENRRTVSVRVGDQMVAQGFTADSNGGLTVPSVLLRTDLNGAEAFSITAAGLGADLALASKSPASLAAHDLAVDNSSRNHRLWMARGPWGITRSAFAPSSWVSGIEAIPAVTPVFLLNPTTASWDTLQKTETLDTASHLAVWALSLDSNDGSLWIGSEKGLWSGNRDQSELVRHTLGGIDTLRVTGVWRSPTGERLVVESSLLSEGKQSSQTLSSLWQSLDSGKTFAAVAVPYDSLNVSVSGVAFLGDDAWIAVLGIGNSASGLLRIGHQGAKQWPDSLAIPNRETSSRYVWGLEAHVVDRDVFVTGITTFALGSGTGLALSTDGAGVSVSADSGSTWKQILNQKAVKGALSEVRMVPSVLRGYGASVIAYRLNKDAKVTIEVFSYDMRKVKTVVRNAPRLADLVRSSDARSDVWDGSDDTGNPVVLGMYYVRVRDDKSHESWGKIMWMGGRQ